VPLGCAASGPQVALAPLHVSATSQSPTDGRHDVPARTSTSAGQLTAMPVQFSATSQSPALARHTVDAGSYFGSHVAVRPIAPEHRSWASHAPFGKPPHAVPGVTAASGAHAGLTPLHASARSHSPTEGRHTVPFCATASGGHAGLAPLQFSTRSQLPPLPRQIVVGGW